MSNAVVHLGESFWILNNLKIPVPRFWKIILSYKINIRRHHEQYCSYWAIHSLFNNLYNIFIIEYVFFANLLRVMLHRGAPHQSTGEHTTLSMVYR